MNTRIAALFVFGIAISLFLVACGSEQTISTGVPAAGAEKFYFHMEKEATARGFDTYRDTQDGLDVHVDRDAYLSYHVLGDEIVVTLHVDDLGDGNEDLERKRLSDLRRLNLLMIDRAIDRADRTNVFEQKEL